jgi:hypothetical protein
MFFKGLAEKYPILGTAIKVEFLGDMVKKYNKKGFSSNIYV